MVMSGQMSWLRRATRQSNGYKRTESAQRGTPRAPVFRPGPVREGRAYKLTFCWGDFLPGARQQLRENNDPKYTGCARAASQCEEAVGHYQEMLRFNPNDNQGIRYLLLDCLLFLGSLDDAAELISKYDEDGSAALELVPRAAGISLRGRLRRGARSTLTCATRE